jgi:hypothetical protein
VTAIIGKKKIDYPSVDLIGITLKVERRNPDGN